MIIYIFTPAHTHFYSRDYTFYLLEVENWRMKNILFHERRWIGSGYPVSHYSCTNYL